MKSDIFEIIQLHYERTEARRKLLKDHGQTETSGEEMKVSDRWKRVLGSALSSIEPKDDSKPQATSLLSRVVALNRKKIYILFYIPSKFKY